MMTITTEVVAAREKRDTKGRRIAARERREELLAEFDASGLTQRAFARREGINANTFAKWVWLRGRSRRAGRVQFAELSLPAKPAWSFEVALPNGCVVRAASAGGVAELLGLIQG